MYYYTVKNYGKFEYTVERSRFIGYVKPVSSEEEASDFIRQIKLKHHDAKHNCFAYIIRGITKRYSDDGEPSGTAGLPMLDILEKSGLQDVVLVVTRYFGGILLGTGGLVRAYSSTAKGAVQTAGICRMCESREFSLTCSYSDYDKLLHFLKDNSCCVTHTDFFEEIIVKFSCEVSLSDALEKRLSDYFSGRINAQCTGKGFICEDG